MINDLINSLLKNLEFYFPNVDKYVENVEQGFQAPCFLINVINYDKTNLMENARFYRDEETIDIELIYFPKESKLKNTQKREIAELTQKIVTSVERISLYDKQIRSNNVKAVTIDNTLEVLLSFNFNTVYKYKKYYMERLERVNGGVING